MNGDAAWVNSGSIGASAGGGATGSCGLTAVEWYRSAAPKAPS
jgi:hypothetical protein